MWRKGFTFEAQTPHLKFGLWNNSRVSTVFSGVDQTKYSLDTFTSNSPAVSLNEVVPMWIFLYVLCLTLGSKWMTSIEVVSICLFYSPTNTQKNAQFPLSQTDYFARMQRSSSPLCLVWFSIWFGIFKVCYSTLRIWLFRIVFFSAKTVCFFI